MFGFVLYFIHGFSHLAKCKEGYLYNKITMSCYKRHPTLLTYPDAQSVCQKDGGNLASIHSQEEELFLAGTVTLTKHTVTDFF